MTNTGCQKKRKAMSRAFKIKRNPLEEHIQEVSTLTGISKDTLRVFAGALAKTWVSSLFPEQAATVSENPNYYKWFVAFFIRRSKVMTELCLDSDAQAAINMGGSVLVTYYALMHTICDDKLPFVQMMIKDYKTMYKQLFNHKKNVEIICKKETEI